MMSRRPEESLRAALGSHSILEDMAYLKGLGDSERSWCVPIEEIAAKGCDLKAVNPYAKKDEDTRSTEELLDLIEAKGQEISKALVVLRGQRQLRG